MKLRAGFSMFKRAGQDFLDDDALTLAGALAFYTALSLAPLLVILLWIAGLAGTDMQSRLTQQVVGLVGPQAGAAIETILASAAQRPALGSVAGLISAVVLLFSASGVFAQLQQALNRIWEVEPRPGQGLWSWVRKRLLSFGMVLTLGFLLLVSLALSAVLAALLGAWVIVENLVALVVFAALFAVLFRFLPDARIAWRDALVGAIVTAGLFALGKLLIGLYLGHSSVGSAYGAAGSLIVLLVWVYYSAMILFFGAELTQVRARAAGRGIVPDEHARLAPGAPDQQPAPA